MQHQDRLSWGKCQLTHTNRPSLGSWQGWPWDVGDPLAQRALSVGLKGKALQVICEWSTPEQIYGGSGDPMVGLFIPVWSREKGALAEPAAAVQAAVEAYAEDHRNDAATNSVAAACSAVGSLLACSAG